jgi:hypothetical protein
MKYESPITYHSKDMANVKVFADRQAKNYMPSIFRYGGIKICQNIKGTGRVLYRRKMTCCGNFRESFSLNNIHIHEFKKP